jgi:hypothetical protein
MYKFPEDRPVATVRGSIAANALALELRSIANECHAMGLSTNGAGWHALAAGFLRCVTAFDNPGARPEDVPVSFSLSA